MKAARQPLALRWAQIGANWLPFADVATKELPLSRLLRLALFQVSVGMAAVLLTGTLNRVMIVELGVPAWTVALMVSIPLLAAPFRALIGYKSDNHRSVLGLRRVPYIWFGSLIQFGGFAIMPFSLLIMSGDTTGSPIVGQVFAALAFFLVGIGMHTTQTAGLALATDLATEETRPRVVALLYVMLLVGMFFSALIIGALLANFSAIRLVGVIQGVAELTMILNIIALWKQEPRNRARTENAAPGKSFRETWADYTRDPRIARLLVGLGLGTAAFSMQDVLLEPYGAQVLGLSVGQTTGLTALWSAGALLGFVFSANRLNVQADPLRLAAIGILAGIFAFALVVWSAPANSVLLLRLGVGIIGFGSGTFSVALLISAMTLAREDKTGLALGAWGAVQATATGFAAAIGGGLRDTIGELAAQGSLGAALSGPASGYQVVYHFEIALLFASLIALGPLARRVTNRPFETAPQLGPRFGITEFPT
jgi:MFS transporter, BCD family, chlorophyll transporter